MFRPKRFLVPVDFSRESMLAMDWAIHLARSEQESSIGLVYVLPLSASGGDEAVSAQKARERLRECWKMGESDLTCFLWTPSGRVADEIARLVKEERIDLVVMTTRGRFGNARFPEGSMTEETIRVTPCPVLVLHLNRNTANQVGEWFDGVNIPPGGNAAPL